MKKLQLTLLTAVFLYLGGNSAFAQFSLNIHIGRPPVWAPSAYAGNTRYYYFPTLDLYYDAVRNGYYYAEGGDNWVFTPFLPYGYTESQLMSIQSIPLNYAGDTPYIFYAPHRLTYVRRYHPGWASHGYFRPHRPGIGPGRPRPPRPGGPNRPGPGHGGPNRPGPGNGPGHGGNRPGPNPGGNRPGPGGNRPGGPGGNNGGGRPGGNNGGGRPGGNPGGGANRPSPGGPGGSHGGGRPGGNTGGRPGGGGARPGGNGGGARPSGNGGGDQGGRR